MKRLIFIAVATVMTASSAFAQQIVVTIPTLTAPVVQTQVNTTTQVPIATGIGIFGVGTATSTAANATGQAQNNQNVLTNFGLGFAF